MKIRRLAVISVIFISTLVLSNLFTFNRVAQKFSQNYPAAVCPPTDSNVSSQVSVASTNTPFRKIVGKITSLSPIRTTRYTIVKDAILLDQSNITSVTWQNLVGTWAGATLCAAPQGDQWFVGGAGDVTSKGRLYVVNSGLSDAIVDVAVWSENGPQPGKVLTVPANSSLRVPLDSIVTGQTQLSIRVTPRSGRVNAFLMDERGKGLQPLGGDLVNSIDFPRTDFVISGIPHQIIKGKDGSNVLRILAPGNLNANIRVDLISSDGVFVPVGLDGRDIPQGRVTDITLKPTISASAFSLRIRSDQPIVAGVYTALALKGHQDFVWNSVTPSLVPMTVAINGLTPTFVFTGDAINLRITARLTSGVLIIANLKGSDIVLWKVPDKTQSIAISNIQSTVAGAGLVSSVSGIGAFPLTSGSALARAAVPVSDIGVINR